MKKQLYTLIHYLKPEASSVSLREKALSGFLALIAMLVVLFSNHAMIGFDKAPLILASIGATSLLLFATPLSPVSQPWAVIAGHTLSAIIGIFCFQSIENIVLAAALAVSLSIFIMYVSDCLHPPGGATALAFVVAGPEIHTMGYEFVLTPVLSSMVPLILMAFFLNNLVPGRYYPSSLEEKGIDASDDWAVGKSVFDQSDLDVALEQADIYMDISRADLNKIYRLAIQHANQRRIGNVSCSDIMSRELTKFEYSTELAFAWQTLNEKKLKAAPVIDNFNRVVGIVTINDFMRHANLLDISLANGDDLQTKMKRFLMRTEGHESQKAEVVGQIMTHSPVVVDEDEHIVNLVPIFTEKNIHHLPVVDNKKVLSGMITRSDIMRALALLRV